MDRIRELLRTIQAQLGVLTVSQRLAIGLCAALAAGSMLWLLQWSTTPDLTPLLAHNFSVDELNGAEEALRTNGLTYRVQGSRIYVRASDRYDALRVLNGVNALPEGSLFDMQTMVSDQNPFQSPESREYAQNYAKGNELAKIIATYPNVKKASVLVNPSTRRRIGGPSDEPTASVTVTLGSGHEMSYEMVEAFAKLVSGAVGGLKPYNVNVVDGRTIQSFNTPRPEDGGNVEHFRMVQKLEERLLQKVRGKLADIPGVLATVTVELDTSKRVRQTNLHESPQPKMEKTHTADQNSSDQPTEPGVQANVGQAVTASGIGQRSLTEESTVENFEPKLRESETVEQGPTIKKATASVGIPRSFVVSVFRANHPDTPEPKDDDPAFTAIRDDQIARVKGSVEKIIMARSPQDVQVDVYPDVEWGDKGPSWQSAPGGVTTAQAGTGSFEIVELLRGYAPQAGLTALALMSLFMVMKVVRKSAEYVSVPAMSVESTFNAPDVPTGDEPLLAVGPQTIGQAASSDGFLVGREVDDDSLRFAELSAEVSKMVEEDPAGAADMLRRWVDET
ncbi:MAG: flagellar M-ring protein FliF C-terminal domain-containing protein [Planctomycetota bacterium]